MSSTPIVATHDVSRVFSQGKIEVRALDGVSIEIHPGEFLAFTGPSGSGKTTTLYAMLREVDAIRRNVTTIEDPVEYDLPFIRQSQVDTSAGFDFNSGLRALLRQDPDVILVGEMRDLETISTALTAAETGHLVLATMSTPSGAQTIGRLIDMFPPEDQSQVRATLAGALKLVVSQRLIDSADATRQVAAFEVITGNVPLWSLIRDQKLHQLPSLLQRGRAYGMVRLEDSLRGLMLSQTITRAAAIANADDPKLLAGEDNAAPPSRRARGGRR